MSAWDGTKPKESDRKGSAKAKTTATRGSSLTACSQSGSAARWPPHGDQLPNQPNHPPGCSSAPPGGRKALAAAGGASQCARSGHSCTAAAAAVARPATAAAAALLLAPRWLPDPCCWLVCRTAAVRAWAQPACRHGTSGGVNARRRRQRRQVLPWLANPSLPHPWIAPPTCERFAAPGWRPQARQEPRSLPGGHRACGAPGTLWSSAVDSHGAVGLINPALPANPQDTAN